MQHRGRSNNFNSVAAGAFEMLSLADVKYASASKHNGTTCDAFGHESCISKAMQAVLFATACERQYGWF